MKMKNGKKEKDDNFTRTRDNCRRGMRERKREEERGKRDEHWRKRQSSRVDKTFADCNLSYSFPLLPIRTGNLGQK
jgi:hypothetical protein